MNWVEEDICITLEQSEYIDTAIIPLCRISWGVQALEHAKRWEYMKKLCYVLEKSYRGRMIVFPSLFFSDVDKIKDLIHLLKEQLINGEVKYLFYLSCDDEIQSIIQSVIIVPNLPIEKMEHENQLLLLESQVKNVMKYIQKHWE